jgi:hypothetical protein
LDGSARGDLPNNLDLTVKTSGRERHGNKAEGDPIFDDVNDVEQIVWQDTPVRKAKSPSERATLHLVEPRITRMRGGSSKKR